MAIKPTYEELEQRIKDLEKRLEQREETLRLSVERNRLATSAAKVGVWDWNIKTGDFYLDPNIKAILGYTDDEIPNDLEIWVKYVHPEDNKAVMEAAQACLDGKTSEYIFEHRMLHKDGSNRWILVRGKAIRDENGNAVRLIGTDADITDRKRMEKTLQESEEVYRTLVESANSIILKWDTKGHIIYLNPYGLEFFKYRKEEVIGKHVIGTIILKNETTGRDLSEMINNITKNPLEYKNNLNQNICSDGELVWVEWTNEAILNASGKLVEILSIGNDVTERKLAQEALRKSKLWLNSIFNSLEEAVLVVTPDRKLAKINSAAERMFGYSQAEVRNLSAEVLHVDHEHYLEFERRVNKAFDKGEAANFEFEAKRKNGEIFPTNHTDTLLKNKQGESLGIVSVVRDITGQKREKEEKKTLEAQLQRAEKMEAIGTLAGGVAHDLNNVLSGIVSYPDLLLMDLPEDSPLRKPILTMQSAGEKAVAIVQDLLTMARRGIVTADVVNLNDIISKYLKSLEYEDLISFHPGVEVKTRLEADLPNLSGSSVHLSKIVMNLVSNAAEAMPHGGTIFISTENRYVDRPLSGYENVEEGDYVVLTVSDPGAGISPKDMKRIFEPFYTKKVMGRSGTGLGMAVVWGTVKDHNGYVDVQSTERKGTTFTLYFPITRKEIAKQKPRLPIDDYMGKEESILVVDDVKEQRELALTLLTKLGYAADTVSSGERAVEYLKEHSVDLIVLDMIMDPGIDGFDTYKKIIEVHPRQKAIIASGFSETDRVKEAQRLGAGQYIKKPYTIENIGLAIKEELGK
jgi:PAS domain S-box-containing protein